MSHTYTVWETTQRTLRKFSEITNAIAASENLAEATKLLEERGYTRPDGQPLTHGDVRTFKSRHLSQITDAQKRALWLAAEAIANAEGGKA